MDTEITKWTEQSICFKPYRPRLVYRHDYSRHDYSLVTIARLWPLGFDSMIIYTSLMSAIWKNTGAHLQTSHAWAYHRAREYGIKNRGNHVRHVYGNRQPTTLVTWLNTGCCSTTRTPGKEPTGNMKKLLSSPYSSSPTGAVIMSKFEEQHCKRRLVYALPHITCSSKNDNPLGDSTPNICRGSEPRVTDSMLAPRQGGRRRQEGS